MNTKQRSCLISVVFLAALFILPAHARNPYRNNFFDAYPSAVGTVLDSVPSHPGHCGVCHYSFDGGGPRNPYGIAVEATDRSVAAILALGGLDSDGDGFSNDAEITDTINYANIPTFPGLNTSNVGNVDTTTVDLADILDYLTPGTNRPDGLVAYYPLDSNVLDYSAFTNDGTAFNVTFSEYGAYFDGTAGITIPESPSLQLGYNISVSVWVKVSNWGSTGGNTGYPLVVFNNSSTYPSDPHERAVAAFINENASDFTIHSVDAYPNSVFTSSRAASTESTESVSSWESGVSLESWSLLVWTYDGTNITSYLDGSPLYQNEFYSSSNNLSPYSGYQFVRIGHDQTGDSLPSFQGHMREVRIYDACLSSSDVSQMYSMDTDGDGLRDVQELNDYGSNPNSSDTDGDGFNDDFEVSTGFDPASSSSTPDLLSEIQTAIEFKFNAANGVSYRIEAADNLTNVWETLETDIIGEGGVVNRLYSIEGQSNRFFRAMRN